MAENSETDWILINLKFRGKCVGCGKVITSGRALWSKSTKRSNIKIAFLERPTNRLIMKKSDPVTKKCLHARRHRKTIVQRCLICGKEEPVEDEYDSNEYHYLAESRS